MDNLLVGTLSLPKFPSENSLPSVMSSATSSLWKTFWDHRNHRSENRDQLITISPESVIIFPRNPDHDHPGIAIMIARNLRSPSPAIPNLEMYGKLPYNVLQEGIMSVAPRDQQMHSRKSESLETRLTPDHSLPV